MASVKLHDGREIAINLHAISMREYRTMLNPAGEVDEGDEILGKVLGLTLEEVQSFTPPDYRLAIKRVLEAASAPLENDPKNSASASTSP